MVHMPLALSDLYDLEHSLTSLASYRPLYQTVGARWPQKMPFTTNMVVLEGSGRHDSSTYVRAAFVVTNNLSSEYDGTALIFATLRTPLCGLSLSSKSIVVIDSFELEARINFFPPFPWGNQASIWFYACCVLIDKHHIQNHYRW